MGSTPHHSPPGLDGIRELASRESAGIVLEAAARIERLIAEAEAELRVLKGTIDAAAPSRTGADTFGAPIGAPAPVLPVPAPARHALADARRALDRLLQELASSSSESSRVRVRTAPVLLGTAMLLLAAGVLGLATGWLAMPRAITGMPPAAAGPGDPAPAQTVATNPVPPPPGDRRGEVDALREDGISWLRAYFSGRLPAANARRASPIIRDERAPSERVAVAATRRTITPGRVDIFGDAAVLSASVTERSADGRALVSLVSQLWTRRTDGHWQLDDVRIVSAAGAERAFRR